jgi:hypothetical protein
MALIELTPTQRKYVQCVAVALQFLPNSYCEAIISSMTLAITTLEGLMALLEAQLLTLFGFLQLLQAQKAMILNVINSYKSQIMVIGASVAQQCPALGEVNQVIDETVTTYMAPLYAIINQIDCFNRLYLEYQEKKAFIQAQIDMLKVVRTAVQQVLNLRAAAVMVANTAVK